MTIDAAQIELLRALSGAGGAGSGAGAGVAGLSQVLAQTSGFAGSIEAALRGNAGARSPLGSGGLGSILPGVTSGLAGGLGGGLLGLSPILAGLRALFGGGSEQSLPALTKYVAPEAVNLSLGLTGDGRNVGAASYGQSGVARVAPAITVNVNAIDSKSFSDHSETIARVVREAMLNSGALTDVMSEI